MSEGDPVARAAEWMVRRDEEDNYVNPGLNELEGLFFLKLQDETLNSAVGEAAMRAFKTEMAMELLKTISAVARTFEILPPKFGE